jgi:predicted signal transduction protein with EAL and GGDEF domain
MHIGRPAQDGRGRIGGLQRPRVPEGVETAQQRDTVHMLGCTQMQGYLFSRPLPARELRGLLASERTAAEDAATTAHAAVA